MKISKTLSRLTHTQKKTQDTNYNIRNETRDVTTDIKIIIREYYDQLNT